MIRHISDLHINDPAIFDWRPQFSTHEEMNDYLVERWNRKVTDDDDITIIAGDIGYCHPKTVSVLNQLNGRKILVKGNHDIEWGVALYNCGCFDGVFEFLTMKGILVAHIPDERLDSQKYYYIHGHHHRYDMLGMHKAYKEYVSHPLRLNCSADLLDFTPRTLNELIMSKEILIEKMEEKQNGTNY